MSRKLALAFSYPPEQAAARNAVLAALVAPLIHRVNNSLAVIQGTFETGAERLDAGRLLRGRDESQRVGRLVGSLSSFAKDHDFERVRSGSIEILAFAQRVEDLVRPYLEQGHVDFERRTILTAGTLEGVEVLLLQALSVVMAEAARPIRLGSYTPGQLRPGLRLSLAVEKQRFTMRVVSSGPLPEGLIQGPLRDFVRSIADQHEARLQACSGRDGRASGFSIVFPAERVANLAFAAPTEFRKHRVLLIEPATELGQLVRVVLEDSDLRVSVASTATAAREALTSNYDLLLFDAELEESEPGQLDALIVESANQRRGLLGSASTTLARGLPRLPKPFRPHELRAFVDVLLAPDLR